MRGEVPIVLDPTFRVSDITWYSVATTSPRRISANVVKYPDGTIKWGKKSPEDLDFIAESTDHGVESAISSFITIHASDYNITELDIAK